LGAHKVRNFAFNPGSYQVLLWLGKRNKLLMYEAGNSKLLAVTGWAENCLSKLIFWSCRVSAKQGERMRNLMSSAFGLGMVLAGSIVVNGVAADRDPSLYVGTKSCAMCHKKADTGDQFGKWQSSPHAKTYEMLASPEAKAAGAKVGVAEPQKSGKCLKCHSTAYNFTEEVKADTTKVLVEDGVSCESCHGPGKNYKSKAVMEDQKKCIEGGMIHPATDSCTLCHNEQSPT
jgi:hypothetical protein